MERNLRKINPQQNNCGCFQILQNERKRREIHNRLQNKAVEFLVNMDWCCEGLPAD